MGQGRSRDDGRVPEGGRPLRVVFVSTRPPLPHLGGAALRGYNFIRLLGPRHDVHLVCHATVREQLDLKRLLGDMCEGIHTVTPPEGRGIVQRVTDLATSSLPDLARRFPSRQLHRAVVEEGRQCRPELVHVLGLESAPAAFGEDDLAIPRAKTVLDELNAEFVLQRRAFQVSRQAPAELALAGYSLVQAVKLRRYEQSVCSRSDGVITVSWEDELALRGMFPDVPTAVIPNGVDVERYSPDSGVKPALPIRTLLFIGTMDFRPNVDAVTWFVRRVLPSVRSVLPEVHLVIAGREPTAEVQALGGEGVTVAGSVPDDQALFRSADLFVLPMRFGGGSRLKLLQAFACGLPVVSTRLGASGIDLVHGQHALLADAPGLFAYYVVRMLRDPEYGRTLAARGRQLALGYDWRHIVPKLERFYEQVLAAPVALRR